MRHQADVLWFRGLDLRDAPVEKHRRAPVCANHVYLLQQRAALTAQRTAAGCTDFQAAHLWGRWQSARSRSLTINEHSFIKCLPAIASYILKKVLHYAANTKTY
jgi:hypothetical protein